MTTMTISLPAKLKAFGDAEVERRGFGSNSESVRSLIRHDQEREALRTLLLEGATSPVDAASNDDYFACLRDRIAPYGSR